MGVFVGLGSSKFFGSIPACLDALVGTDDSRGHRGGTASQGMVRNHSLLFDLEAEPEVQANQGSNSLHRQSAASAMDRTWSVGNTQLLGSLDGPLLRLCSGNGSEMEKKVNQCMRQWKCITSRSSNSTPGNPSDDTASTKASAVEDLAAFLQLRGFLVLVQHGGSSSPESVPGPSHHQNLPAKAPRNPLKQLHHTFVLVLGYMSPALDGHTDTAALTPVLAPEPLIADPSFKEQFLIASAKRAPEYEEAMQLLPPMYVGTASRLEALVALLSQRVAAAFAAERRSLPPWRTREAQLSKWALPSVADIAWQLRQEGLQAVPVQQALAMTSAALKLLTLVGGQPNSQGSSAQVLPECSMMPMMSLRRHMSGPMDTGASSMSSSSSGLSCFIEQEIAAATSTATGQGDADMLMADAQHNINAAAVTVANRGLQHAAPTTVDSAAAPAASAEQQSQQRLQGQPQQGSTSTALQHAEVIECPQLPQTPHPGLFHTPFNNQWMPQQADDRMCSRPSAEVHLQIARGSLSGSKQPSFNDHHSNQQLLFDRQSSEEVRVSAQQRRKQQRSALAAALQASGPLESGGLPGREHQVVTGPSSGPHTQVASHQHKGAAAAAVVPPAHRSEEQVHQQVGNNRMNSQNNLMKISKVKWGSGLLPAQPGARQAPH